MTLVSTHLVYTTCVNIYLIVIIATTFGRNQKKKNSMHVGMKQIK